MVRQGYIRSEFFNHNKKPVVKGDSCGDPIRKVCPKCGKEGVILVSPDGVYCPYCDYNFEKKREGK